MELHQTESLLHNKRNTYQTEKTAYSLQWEKVFARHIFNKDFITRIYRELNN
jgi:hypothetical protein